MWKAEGARVCRNTVCMPPLAEKAMLERLALVLRCGSHSPCQRRSVPQTDAAQDLAALMRELLSMRPRLDGLESAFQALVKMHAV